MNYNSWQTLEEQETINSLRQAGLDDLILENAGIEPADITKMSQKMSGPHIKEFADNFERLQIPPVETAKALRWGIRNDAHMHLDEGGSMIDTTFWYPAHVEARAIESDYVIPLTGEKYWGEDEFEYDALADDLKSAGWELSEEHTTVYQPRQITANGWVDEEVAVDGYISPEIPRLIFNKVLGYRIQLLSAVIYPDSSDMENDFYLRQIPLEKYDIEPFSVSDGRSNGCPKHSQEGFDNYWAVTSEWITNQDVR